MHCDTPSAGVDLEDSQRHQVSQAAEQVLAGAEESWTAISSLMSTISVST